MAPTRIEVVKLRRLASMMAEERAEFDAAYESARLAVEVDEPELAASVGGFGLCGEEAD